MEIARPKMDYVRFHAIICMVFLLLGLSPISRMFSIFSFFEPELIFIPQYIPYALSLVAGIGGLFSLRGNKSKIFVAAMGNIFKACIIIDLFMMGYFFFNYLLVVAGAAALPEYCVFPGTMECQSAWLSSDNQKLHLSIVSGMGRSIIVTHISCTMNRDQLEQCGPGRCRGFDSSKGGIPVKPGETMGTVVTCNDDAGKPISFSMGDHYTGKVIIGYHYTDEPREFVRKITGSIGIKGA